LEDDLSQLRSLSGEGGGLDVAKVRGSGREVRRRVKEGGRVRREKRREGREEG
jgi:hypothetical protein